MPKYEPPKWVRERITAMFEKTESGKLMIDAASTDELIECLEDAAEVMDRMASQFRDIAAELKAG